MGTLSRQARSPPRRFVRVSNVLLPPNSGAWPASGCREIPFGWNESTGHFSANTSRNSKRACEPRKSSCYVVTACIVAPPGTVLKSSSTTTSRSLVAQRVGRSPEHQRLAAERCRSAADTGVSDAKVLVAASPEPCAVVEHAQRGLLPVHLDWQSQRTQLRSRGVVNPR